MAGGSRLLEEARIGLRAVADRVEDLARPTLRIGVTGLARSGKTVFTTALVEALRNGGRLPVFEPFASGRIAGAHLQPQPDDTVPRFPVEDHLLSLAARAWPASTSRVSELRLAVRHATRRGGMRTLTLDLVDYPGEWLLDLPLLDMTYADFSRESLSLARADARREAAAQMLAGLGEANPAGPADEATARALAARFTTYLSACRAERVAMSLLPPGRFLLPGDLEGSPALTFAPLDLAPGTPPPGSLAAMMERRFEAYKAGIVRPFFREHFARLDRQIVLVDVLAALNAGPAALADLERALDSILLAFRVGRNSLFSALWRPRIEKVLFAATKADHLHRTSHDRLEAILRRLVERAYARARTGGASLDVVAMAAVRATREAEVTRDGRRMAAIVGTPEAGQEAGGHLFDGEEEVALFPGALPEDPETLFDPSGSGFRGLASGDADFRFLRFRPPPGIGTGAPLPHIRLDRALQFLLGDRLG
ncbi:YcjX family protein [Aquabacter cavernae]|uniref:YcjX family protein n=1 Tax=Aquabacter cavernae TaxID=2496029 RepID=UPI000F8C7FC6|nr:YcjX family protein [Aquabacter cavernae]